MNLKSGDIITLDNGDIVEVSLKVVAKKVSKLEVSKTYKLKHNGQFCHVKGTSGLPSTETTIEDRHWQFIGKIDLDGYPDGKRYIFYSNKGSLYSMWGTKSLNFVVNEVV